MSSGKDVLGKTYSQKVSVVLGDLSAKCYNFRIIQIKDIDIDLSVY